MHQRYGDFTGQLLEAVMRPLQTRHLTDVDREAALRRRACLKLLVHLHLRGITDTVDSLVTPLKLLVRSSLAPSVTASWATAEALCVDLVDRLCALDDLRANNRKL